jgi:16S rRNA (guanine966-N2)-methyltransferase
MAVVKIAEGRVRIIGGAWRSRVLRFPSAMDLRPTSDRVRETLFNWLGQDLTGTVCLDLFAGSGALGFEALSRNAKLVTMIERNGAARAALARNGEILQAGARLKVATGDALQFLRRCRERGEQFDLIFCDPPFREEWFSKLWASLSAVTVEGAMVYAESGSALALPSDWQTVKSGKAGQVFYQLLVKQGLARSSLVTQAAQELKAEGEAQHD